MILKLKDKNVRSEPIIHLWLEDLGRNAIALNARSETGPDYVLAFITPDGIETAGGVPSSLGFPLNTDGSIKGY